MRAFTENYGRGWRVLLDLGGEEWVFSIKRAIALRDALTAAIDEAAAKSCLEQAEDKR
jgi:hypothetical protein